MECKEIERSIIKKYKKSIYSKFIKSIKDFELIKDKDKIAVCISGGKDSLLLAKCMQELQIHSKFNFTLEFIVMDPGYTKEDLNTLKLLLDKLNIKANIYQSNIFESIKDSPSPCYLCARKRRGSLYAKAKSLGCNKIALGHNFDDVIETILLNIFYAGEYKTMMPKLKSTNFEGMELIRPLYYVKEEDIISWKNYNKLDALEASCPITKESIGERKHIKDLLKQLKKDNPNIDINILNSSTNIYKDAILGYKEDGKKHSFLEDYDK